MVLALALRHAKEPCMAHRVARDRCNTSRRNAMKCLAGGMVGLALMPRWAWAGGTAVPIPMQAKLIAKAAKYDRNFVQRAGAQAKVLILTKGGNGESADATKRLENAFKGLGSVAGLPISVSTENYGSAGAVASACKSQGYAMLCLTPGLGGDAAAISKALAGVSILSMSTVPDYVKTGAAIGFDLVQGKPKILVNRAVADAQKVSLHPQFLKLADLVG